MLALERLEGETIVITFPGGTEARVTVIGVRTRRGRPVVRLGFEAAREVVIDREELYEAKRREGANGKGIHDRS